MGLAPTRSWVRFLTWLSSIFRNQPGATAAAAYRCAPSDRHTRPALRLPGDRRCHLPICPLSAASGSCHRSASTADSCRTRPSPARGTISVISHASTLCSLPEGSAHFGRAIGWEGPIADHVIDPLFFAGRYRAAFDENWMCCVSTQNIAAAQMKERIHPVVSTMGISGSDSDRRMAWADVTPPSVLRGRLLSSLTTARNSAGHRVRARPAARRSPPAPHR